MKCIHCGVHYSYYASPEHAARKSCRGSKSGYHDFKEVGFYYWYLIYDFFDCKKNKINII